MHFISVELFGPVAEAGLDVTLKLPQAQANGKNYPAASCKE